MIRFELAIFAQRREQVAGAIKVSNTCNPKLVAWTGKGDGR